MHCGRVLTGVRWVASPPDAFRPREKAAPRLLYGGPPRYRAVPRWSLWPWAAPVHAGTADGPAAPAPRADPEGALRAVAELLWRLAATTAVLAVIAAFAEGWRYALLLASRTHALTAEPLAWSDAVVTLVGLLAPVAALATGVVGLRWLLLARGIAADASRTRPSRSSTAIVVGALVPVTTLVVPGAVLAEIEHAASGRPADERPRPSLPVAQWWAVWAASVLVGLVTVARGFDDSTQALADGVVLHGVVDLLAAATALLTVRVTAHLTELLAPELRPRGRSWVVRVGTPRTAETPAPAREPAVSSG